MAYTTLTIIYPTSTGVAPTYTAALAGGMRFSNDGRVAIVVKNSDGSSHTMTAVTPRTVDGLAIADQVITVPATTGERWCTFNPDIYNQPDSAADPGMTYLDFSSVTGMTLAAIHV